MDMQSLRNLLRDSEATWDETAFGAGRYGNDDSNLPSKSAMLQPQIEGRKS